MPLALLTKPIALTMNPSGSLPPNVFASPAAVDPENPPNRPETAPRMPPSPDKEPPPDLAPSPPDIAFLSEPDNHLEKPSTASFSVAS
ncbi:hypothetical protein D9M69_659670 [compost metagenome]